MPPTDVVDGLDDDDHEPEPPSGPPELSGTADAPSADDDDPSPPRTPSKRIDVQGVRRRPAKGPTQAVADPADQPAADPDGTDTSGADGPPII